MTNSLETARQLLAEALNPSYLNIIDESAAHAGHAGAAGGAGHYQAVIVSEAFAGKSLVQRHQLVYRALGNMMRNEIHAFSMKVYTPEEYQPQRKPLHE